VIALAVLGCGGKSSPAPAGGEPRAEAADLVLVGGDVFTPDGHVTAIAVRGERIVARGGDAEVERWIGPTTRVVELDGKSVIVGLTDAHCHLYGLGVDRENVSVRYLDSEAAVVAVVAEAARARPAGEWLQGRGWDQNRWPGQQFPTKASLDAAVGDRPVLLRRIDGHAAWVNSRALAAANVTRATPDPPGGKIVRDARGEPTGVLIDNAIELVTSKLPVASPEVRERRILAAARIAVEHGFTAVHEMGIDDATADVYRKLAAENRLPLRVYAYLAGDVATAEALRTRPPAPAVGRFVMRGVKFFADGALGSRGARLHQDYADDPGNRGLWVSQPAELAAAVEAAVAGGWQTAIHAIGDAGIAATLDAYHAAQVKHPGDHRLRIEHAQVITAKDAARMLVVRAVASMQPTHATSDMPWAEARVGPERIRGAYAWRTMLDHRIPLAFGSDFPVEEVSPLLGLHAAVTRTDPKTGQPAGGWYAAQRMSLDEAVTAFTLGAAYAAGIAERSEATGGGGHTGLAGGAGGSAPRGIAGEAAERADLTVFDARLGPDELPARQAVLTVVGGEIVFERPGALTSR
jgi:predicted amidohydrolase YtcJ